MINFCFDFKSQNTHTLLLSKPQNTYVTSILIYWSKYKKINKNQVQQRCFFPALWSNSCHCPCQLATHQHSNHPPLSTTRVNGKENTLNSSAHSQMRRREHNRWMHRADTRHRVITTVNLKKSTRNSEIMHSRKNREMGSFKALTRNFPFFVALISRAVIFIDR